MAKNKKKQHSITTQITLTIVGLVAGTVLLCWLLNVTLLEGYYTRYKQEVWKISGCSLWKLSWQVCRMMICILI